MWGLNLFRRSINSALVVAALAYLSFSESGCAARRADVFAFNERVEVTSAELRAPDIAYALSHLEVLAESPMELASTASNHFRVLSVLPPGTSVNECERACPSAILYVAVWTGDGSGTHLPRLFRIDGLRAPELVRVVEYEATLVKGSFLRIVLRSNLSSSVQELYEVAVGVEGATVTPVQDPVVQ